MDVADALPRRVGDDAVDQPDRRRVVGGVEQIVGARQMRGEMAEIVVAEAERIRRVGGHPGAGAVQIGEQPIEAGRIDLVERERPAEMAAQFDQRLRIRAGPHRDLQPAVLSPIGSRPWRRAKP